ncbi:MAG: GMC family oxidoreductase N-terminal domain-containing protein [Rhizobiaceae bacterium]|nr:GMC family oxidoreductase N-terminal domain-containing protein [Rhizobiaceae bacterium]
MWDYIIVGAGTAGCVLANRLSEDPNNRVLLLEAGSSDWSPFIHMPGGLGRLTGAAFNWRFHTVPQKNLNGRRVWCPQGKTLGGSSSINAMIYIRGQREDFDDWAALGNRGWSYDDVLPYFRKSENNGRLCDRFHGSDGPLGVFDHADIHAISRAFVNATHQYGLPINPDFNGASAYGAGFYQVNCQRGRRLSASKAFLGPVKRRTNLTIRKNARVLSIKMANGRATGVEVSAGRSTELLVAGREVILSAGAINSPRLLMLSGIGDADELSKIGVTPVHHLAGVGKNLQDHLNVNVHVQTKDPISYDGRGDYPAALVHGARWLLRRTGPASGAIVQGGGFHKSTGSGRPDLQIHAVLATVVHGGQTKIAGNGFSVNSAYLRPHSRGSVSLRSANPMDEPLIDPNYLDDPHDREMAVLSIRKIRDILAQPAMADLIQDERLPGAHSTTDEDLLAYAREYACSDHHPVGTCRMGTGSDAVVGPDLRVKGIDGLRVIDSSIMPRLISGNTNAATMMIAEKGADLVLAGQSADKLSFLGVPVRHEAPKQDAERV